MTEHLKPCPFCKSDGEIVRDNLHMMRGYIVKCSSCGAQTMFYKTKSDAVSVWNNRPLEAETELFRDALETISKGEDECGTFTCEQMMHIAECTLTGDWV